MCLPYLLYQAWALIAPGLYERERKAVVLPDDGPLVLVETRKDLSQIALPFERQEQPRA